MGNASVRPLNRTRSKSGLWSDVRGASAMRDETFLALGGMAAIAAMQIVALSHGIDGALLAGAVGIVAALGGYCAGRRVS